MKRRVFPVAIIIGISVVLAVWGSVRLQSYQHASDENTGQNSGQLAEETQEPVTLDWYVNYSWFSQDWGQNLVSQAITEQTGVSINYITPSGNESEKVGALMSSDSLPDLVTLGWWEPQLNEMITAGMVYSFNELAETYDPELWDRLDEDVINWYTAADGNLYFYPNSFVTPKDLSEHDNISSNQVFMVRGDIYEAIGSPDMTTQEGFYEAVKKAAEMFPEVDGEPLIPVGAHVFNSEGNVSFDQYLQNFLAVPYEKDDALYDRDTDPEYLSWLKMFRRLGAEGYLADDIFIDQRTQMEEKIAAGRYFCMLFQYTDMKDQQTTLYTNSPEKIYVAVDGPRNSAGDDYQLPTTGINGWTVTLISKNCKEPERAIRFIDYMLSEEGQKMIYLGVEGEMYDMVDGEAVVREEVKALLGSDRTAYDQIYGGDDTYWMLQNNVVQLQWKQESPEAIRQLEEWSYPYVIYNGQYDAILPSDSREAVADAKISQLWSDTLKKLLLAPTDEEFDAILADFMVQRDELGFADVQNMKWDLTQEAKEKLGLA